MLGLILLSVIPTGANVFQKLARVFGAGVCWFRSPDSPIQLHPRLTEYKAEGQVFGVGCKIFTITGPVILYGIPEFVGIRGCVLGVDDADSIINEKKSSII